MSDNWWWSANKRSITQSIELAERSDSMQGGNTLTALHT